MAKLGLNAQNLERDQTDVILTISSFGFMLCMVIVVLGIKFRWFKQRLDFEPIPTGTEGSSDGSQVIFKRSSRSSQEQFREPVAALGVFRKKLDEDVIIERPKTLPPIRVRKSSKGPPSFGPPKRNQTPSTVVEKPVVTPPPPPPLPSSSSVTLSSSSGSPKHFDKVRGKTAESQGKKIDFNPNLEIITNGGTGQTFEQLKHDEEQGTRKYDERRPTGYVRPSDDIIQELEDFQREPPKVMPRSIMSDRSKEQFKKNPHKSTKIPTETIKPDDDLSEEEQMGQRRLTGFFPPSHEDMECLQEYADYDYKQKHPSKVVFHLEDDCDEENSTEIAPPSPLGIPRTMLFGSQISSDDDRDSSDGWSAIQRHRNLAQEINEQQISMQKRRENGDVAGSTISEFRNPSAVQEQQPKARTMRDMKRNYAKNDLLLDGPRDGTEA